MKTRNDVWNPMVKFINQTKDSKLKTHAQMLLNQYNTSGGSMIEQELEFFLQSNNY